jgi:cytidine deaminase
MTVEELIAAARAAKGQAYAPYSGFQVGAALLTGTGRCYTGCNIENASFSLTVCAERVALFKAVSEGESDFKAVAIVADGDDYASPCGACRQVLAEFNSGIEVYMVNRQGEYLVRKVSQLLPSAFSLKKTF